MTKRFFIKNNLDFRKIVSTAHAVIILIENIEKAIDNKVFICRVFFDLQKAFDHNILLHKLSHYGIRDIANCWFSSYLSDVFRLFRTLVYQFGCPNSGAQKHFSSFFFQLYFNKKYIEVAVNDFTMHLINLKWRRIQKKYTEEKNNETKRSNKKNKLSMKVLPFI